MCVITLGTDEEQFLRPLGYQRSGHVPGGDNVIPGARGHTNDIKLLDDTIARPRRVGDQHHRLAGRTPGFQCLDGKGKGIDAIVDHAPDITQHHVVVGGNFIQSVDFGSGLYGH